MLTNDNRNSPNDAFVMTRSNGAISWMDEIIQYRLQQRMQRGTVRRLLYSSSDTATTSAARWHHNCDDNQADRTTNNSSTATITSSSTSSAAATGSKIDFSSNDYLGLARDMEQYRMVEQEMEQYVLSMQSPDHERCKTENSQQQYSTVPILGSTGSRLLSGDTNLLHDLEDYLCHIHQAQSALLCNSGYDANLSVVSTLPCTCILYDSYIHNSLHMGIRLWQSQSITSTESSIETSILNERDANSRKATASFQHNNIRDSQQKLEYFKSKGHTIVILIESVYSMDGDIAPVREILDLAASYQSLVVVDEAHGFGVFGRTPVGSHDNIDGGSIHGGAGVLAMIQCEQHPALLTAIYTYGKAAGCHGAVICSPHSKYMKDYWINYAYPIIYSTALPLHSILTIQCSYRSITGYKGTQLRQRLSQLIQYFQSHLQQILNTRKRTYNHPYHLLQSPSPIQALIVPGNMECTNFCQVMFRISRTTMRLFPIKAPTVPIGQERIRIVLHAHNTIQQIDTLLRYIDEALQELLSTCRDGDGLPFQPSPLSKL